jgi:hypothetical protein
MRVGNEEIPERTADRQTAYLVELGGALDRVGIRNLLVSSVRITLRHDIPGIARHLPPELVLYEPGPYQTGKRRRRTAKVSVVTGTSGLIFSVQQAGAPGPRPLAPVGDVEAAVWLLLSLTTSAQA